MRMQPLLCEASGASTALTSSQKSAGKQNPGRWTVCMCYVNSFANRRGRGRQGISVTAFEHLPIAASRSDLYLRVCVCVYYVPSPSSHSHRAPLLTAQEKVLF